MNERREPAPGKCTKMEGYREDAAAAKFGARTDRRIELPSPTGDRNPIAIGK
jgi:hypothetical protein